MDPETMSAMIAAAKQTMDNVDGEHLSGEEQIKAAMQALNLVTGVLREQKGSEEGVLDVLKEARAKAESDRVAKEKAAARAVLREKLRTSR